MADDKHLIERTVSREDVYQGDFMHAVKETVEMPDGRSATREFIVHPGAVMIIPVLDDGQVVLERQYRHAVGRVLIEFPAGKLEAGEDRLDCARRELQEETGYRAAEWAYAGVLHPCISYSTEFIEIWFARGLRLGERQLDEGEFLDVIAATPRQLQAWCRSGEVTDAKTLIGTLWLNNVLSGEWVLDWRR